MSDTKDFTLSWARSKGKATITAEHDDEVTHVDTLDPTSASARTRYAKALASKGCDQQQAENDLLQLATEFEAGATTDEANKATDELLNSIELLNQMDDAIVADAKDKLKNGDLIELIVNDAETLGVTGEEDNVILLYLVGVSRLLDKPANAIVQGSSASGKSHLIEKVAESFPPESKIVVSSMTPQALNHMMPGSLRHKFVVAGERSRLENDDRAEATRALREMLSSGKLSKLMPTKKGGEIVTILIEQDGPIAFVESTTLTDIFNEDLNRCLLIHPDESPEQTKRILMAKPKGSEEHRETVRQTHYAIQRLLRRLRVVIPYQQQLADLMPTDKVEARRLFPMLLSIIQASALLRQYQRPDLGESAIEANEDDYATAYQLLRKPLSEALAGDISDALKTYFGWLTTADIPEQFCVGDLLNCSDNPKSESQTYAIVKELHKANYLLTVEGNHRGKHFKLNDDPVIDDVLPKPAALFEPENRKTA